MEGEPCNLEQIVLYPLDLLIDKSYDLQKKNNVQVVQ